MNKVLILDFGSQYTKLIARRVRELKVYSEIMPYYSSLEEIKAYNPDAIIFSGGPSSVYEKDSPIIDKKILELGLPILGICYGLQLIAYLSSMKVEAAKEREYGLANLIVTDRNSKLLEGFNDGSNVWMSHGDKITDFPSDFRITANTKNTEIAVLESDKRRIYGVQFHPEVVHTEQGKLLLSNFLFKISGLKPEWNMGDFINSTIESIRNLVGEERVLLGLSGGVDSTVLALLLKKAIGDRLIPVFVDTGLLRYNEYENLMDKFKNQLGLNVIGKREGKLFLDRLNNIKSPEKKRKIIGKTFIDVFKRVEKEKGKIKFFAQGTLYPDVIESVSVKGPSAKIKTHHNVGGLPEKLDWILVEPFRELFKDEVREIGRELGLDDEFINRHPFPGPGLAVRILGKVTEEKVRILQLADKILVDELHNYNIYNQVWQAFAVLLPVRSVGVMGDERSYENPVVIRIVESVDGMTADWFYPPEDFLKSLSNRIVNEVKGINRVVYDITSKPPATIEWE